MGSARTWARIVIRWNCGDRCRYGERNERGVQLDSMHDVVVRTDKMGSSMGVWSWTGVGLLCTCFQTLLTGFHRELVEMKWREGICALEV